MALGKKEDQKKVFSLELDQIGARGLPTAKRQKTGKNKPEKESEEGKVSFLDIPSLNTPMPSRYVKPLKSRKKKDGNE
jgi:hypothetical protein